MTIKQFTFNPIGVNTYVIADELSGIGAIIDCGCSTEEEEKELADYIAQNKIEIKHLLSTHLHFDHVYGNAFAAQRYGVQLEASAEDEYLLDWNEQQLKMYNLPMQNRQNVNKCLTDGDRIQVGKVELIVLALPGHTPGGLGFYCEKEKSLFVGDTLFLFGVGRTDLPGGNFTQLMTSISKKLLVLPNDVKVYSGHGLFTTIGYEKENNPYL